MPNYFQLITADELLAEFERLSAQNENKPAQEDGYYTMNDFCQMWNLGKSAVRERLHRAKQFGLLQSKMSKRENLSGTYLVPTPVYKIAKPVEEPKKKRA